MHAKAVVTIMALLALAAMPVLAATACPPSSPWPPTSGPIVKTVPWVVPQPPLCIVTPHDTTSGATIYLKATTDATATQYYWEFGDGNATSWTNVVDSYNIGVQHTYTGTAGQTFTAVVHVKNAAGIANTGNYYVTIESPSLQVSVNIAIDQALWRLHREMRSRSGSGDAMVGLWNGGAYTASGYTGNTAVNTTAFLVNGHGVDSDPTNPDPYAETALRGMNATLSRLTTMSIPGTVTNNRGTYNPDGNHNGIATYANDTYPPYHGGMVMDMLVATGRPDFIANVGGSGIVGHTLKDILQDNMDYYTYCQTRGSGHWDGGWRYGCTYNDSDNSICQWAAIGMIAAVDPSTPFQLQFPPPSGGSGPSPVLLANQDWLNNDFEASSGGFCYGGSGYLPGGNCYPWGGGAVIPSGMVQEVMNGAGRGPEGGAPTHFDSAENWVRANFNSVLSYYYGLFSFTKSMLKYPGGKQAELCGRDSTNHLINCIDWYADPSLGLATRLVHDQNPDGFWWGHYVNSGEQQYFETAWATIMLNRTVYATGLPVAIINATPSTQVVNGGAVDFTGKNSYQQDPTKQIVKWEWDFSGTGSGPFNVSGVNQLGVVIHTNSLTFPVDYPVRLRVTDNSAPTPFTAITTLTIRITVPPFPPTANAGGPYSICPQSAYLPFYLNGTASQPGTGPPNVITKYEWDLQGNGNYTVYGPDPARPRADDFYSSLSLLGSGSTILVNLRVTDNSKAVYGTADNLQGTGNAPVVLRTALDVLCTKCVQTGQAIGHGAVPGHAAYIALLWIETGADHYNIYRGTVNGGPYTMIGKVTNTVVGTGKTLSFADNGPFDSTLTYYYRIAPATIADIETCQSNQATCNGSIPRGR